MYVPTKVAPYCLTSKGTVPHEQAHFIRVALCLNTCARDETFGHSLASELALTSAAVAWLVTWCPYIYFWECKGGSARLFFT